MLLIVLLVMVVVVGGVLLLCDLDLEQVVLQGEVLCHLQGGGVGRGHGRGGVGPVLIVWCPRSPQVSQVRRGPLLEVVKGGQGCGDHG